MSTEITVSFDGLKERIINAEDSSVRWDARLELQKLYERLILNDVTGAMARHLDHELWAACYKRCIDHLQSQKDDPNAAALLSTFLLASSTYLANFLMKIGDLYDISLPSLVSKRALGLKQRSGRSGMTPTSDVKNLALFCFIHLGDLARYQRQPQTAHLYYEHGRKLQPSNGHSYNQLAIIAQSRGHRLAAAYFYARAIWVSYPFAPASSNFEHIFSALVDRNKDVPTPNGTFVDTFLSFAAFTHTLERLDDAAAIGERLAKTAFDNLDSQHLKHDDALHVLGVSIALMAKILDFNNEDSQDVPLGVMPDGLVSDEMKAFDLIYRFFWSFFTALVKYVSFVDGHTLKLFSVPIRMGYMWIHAHEKLVFKRDADSFSGFVPVLANFLNSLQESGELRRPKNFKDSMALPEDIDLVEFSPLVNAFSKFQFLPGNLQNFDEAQIQKARMIRVLTFGIWFSDAVNDRNKISYESEGSGKILFSCLSAAKQIVDRSEPGSPSVPKGKGESQSGEEKRPGSNTSVLSEHSSPTPSTQAKARSSKLVAINSILNNNREEGGKGKPPGLPSRITIAQPGSKVELPDPSETAVGEEQDAVESEPITLTAVPTVLQGGHQLHVKKTPLDQIPNLPLPGQVHTSSNGNQARYEVPPRFIAARLKMALGGPRPDSTAPREEPRNDVKEELHPLLVESGRFSVETRDQAQQPTGPMAMMMPPPEMHGTGGGDMGHFPKTPGARPQYVPGDAMSPPQPPFGIPGTTGQAGFSNFVFPQNPFSFPAPPPGMMMGDLAGLMPNIQSSAGATALHQIRPPPPIQPGRENFMHGIHPMSHGAPDALRGMPPPMQMQMHPLQNQAMPSAAGAQGTQPGRMPPRSLTDRVEGIFNSAQFPPLATSGTATSAGQPIDRSESLLRLWQRGQSEQQGGTRQQPSDAMTFQHPFASNDVPRVPMTLAGPQTSQHQHFLPFMRPGDPNPAGAPSASQSGNPMSQQGLTTTVGGQGNSQSCYSLFNTPWSPPVSIGTSGAHVDVQRGQDGGEKPYVPWSTGTGS